MRKILLLSLLSLTFGSFSYARTLTCKGDGLTYTEKTADANGPRIMSTVRLVLNGEVLINRGPNVRFLNKAHFRLSGRNRNERITDGRGSRTTKWEQLAIVMSSDRAAQRLFEDTVACTEVVPRNNPPL